MIIRAKFAEEGILKYLSHLELMDVFRRSFRRANIPMAYSHGYNPHPVFSVAWPLPVGMAGKGEYFDLEVIEEIDPVQFCESVNAQLPAGLQIIKARNIDKESSSLMAVINTAVYDIRMEIAGRLKQEQFIEKFLSEERIMVIRKRRNKKDRELDIRSLIERIGIIQPDLWRFVVRTGSRSNLRPEELLGALVEYSELIKPVPIINIERDGLYIKKGELLYQPFDDEVIGS